MGLQNNYNKLIEKKRMNELWDKNKNLSDLIIYATFARRFYLNTNANTNKESIKNSTHLISSILASYLELLNNPAIENILNYFNFMKKNYNVKKKLIIIRIKPVDLTDDEWYNLPRPACSESDIPNIIKTLPKQPIYKDDSICDISITIDELFKNNEYFKQDVLSCLNNNIGKIINNDKLWSKNELFYNQISNVLFIFYGFYWSNIIEIFKKYNINISSGNISNRNNLSTVQFKLSEILFMSCFLEDVPIYKIINYSKDILLNANAKFNKYKKKHKEFYIEKNHLIGTDSDPFNTANKYNNNENYWSLYNYEFNRILEFYLKVNRILLEKNNELEVLNNNINKITQGINKLNFKIKGYSDKKLEKNKKDALKLKNLVRELSFHNNRLNETNSNKQNILLEIQNIQAELAKIPPEDKLKIDKFIEDKDKFNNHNFTEK